MFVRNDDLLIFDTLLCYYIIMWESIMTGKIIDVLHTDGYILWCTCLTSLGLLVFSAELLYSNLHREIKKTMWKWYFLYNLYNNQ